MISSFRGEKERNKKKEKKILKDVIKKR